MARWWYPEKLMDEHLPVPRESAEAWLEPNEKGITDLHYNNFTRRYGVPADVWFPGETVTFKWCEARGELLIKIRPDGVIASTLRCAFTPDFFDPVIEPPPRNIVAQDANSFRDFNSGICATTVEDLARQVAEFRSGFMDEDGEIISVIMARWSDRISFIISADGKSLTPVSEASNHVHG